MTLKHIRDIAIEGKRVFIRVDFNVPLTKNPIKVADDSRIKAALPTIEHCVGRGARVILGSHLGRPKGKPSKDASLEPVAGYLAGLLKKEVVLTDEPTGDGVRKVIGDMREGQIVMLENLRFDPGEEGNDETLSRTLASYADVYCNDAFGTAHRAHASTVGMVRFVAEKAAGFIMHSEIAALSKLLGEVDRPYLAVIGGAKVSDKIEVLDALLDRVNEMVIGGAMANTFLLAKGANLGKSLVEQDRLAIARNFLRKAQDKSIAIHLPTDVLAAENFEATSGKAVSVADFPESMMALDIGPATISAFTARVKVARTIFWNGPMGVFEKPEFSQGTFAIAKAMAENPRAYSVVGGGDSAAAVNQAGVSSKISHVSTGGGASLEFVQGLVLPGITALQE